MEILSALGAALAWALPSCSAGGLAQRVAGGRYRWACWRRHRSPRRSGSRQAGVRLLAPGILAAGSAVAVMTCAVPYALEMVAPRRLDRKRFGVLMSLKPPAAALAALVLLGERLSPVPWIAITCVMAASFGIILGARRKTPDDGIAPSMPGPP